MQQMIADTLPKMYYLHNNESTSVKIQFRSCHSSAQNTPMLYDLTQSKRVIFVPISCNSLLAHAYHASSSGSLPLLFLPQNTFSTVFIIPSSPSHPYPPSPTTLPKTADNSSQPSFYPSLLNCSPQPSPSAHVLYILLCLTSLTSNARSMRAGILIYCLYPHHLEKCLAYSKPSINIGEIKE